MHLRTGGCALYDSCIRSGRRRVVVVVVVRQKMMINIGVCDMADDAYGRDEVDGDSDFEYDE